MAESLLSIKLAAKLAQSYIRQLAMERTITRQRETIQEKARLTVTLETLVKELEDRLRERTNDKS